MRVPRGLARSLFLPIGPAPSGPSPYGSAGNLLVRLVLPGIGLLPGFAALLGVVFAVSGTSCPTFFGRAMPACTRSLALYLLILAGVIASFMIAWRATFQHRWSRALALLTLSGVASLAVPVGFFELVYGSSGVNPLPPLTSSSAWEGWLVLALASLFWGLYLIAEVSAATRVRNAREERRHTLGLD